MNNEDIEKLKKIIANHEDEVIEYKMNNEDQERIGRYVSALANSSALLQKEHAYMIWGIKDDTKEIVGTTFYPKTLKRGGGEPFITWLERMISPRINIHFEEYDIEGKHVVVLVILMNAGSPLEFDGKRYIRSGSSVKNLSEYKEKERELWKSFEARSFEKEFAKTNCSFTEVHNLLDLEVYKKMLEYGEISEKNLISNMIRDGIIEQSGGVYNITNLGAFTFSKNLDTFEGLKSKSLRIIRYKGNNKLATLVDETLSTGIAVGFEWVLKCIKDNLPKNPEILKEGGQIISETDFPLLVIREIVANQVVHQDFSIKGSSPMIEIFDNRVVFTNPGAPLNKPERLLDLPPYSRNEALADLFRKMHLVESRGSGIDKVVITLEMENLPAPDISSEGDFTTVTLFARRNIQDLDDREKINTIFYHAARLYIEKDYMTNRSIRARFGLSPKQSSIASKLISLALNSGKIKIYDENAGNKHKKYIPYWGLGYNE